MTKDVVDKSSMSVFVLELFRFTHYANKVCDVANSNSIFIILKPGISSKLFTETT